METGRRERDAWTQAGGSGTPAGRELRAEQLGRDSDKPLGGERLRCFAVEAQPQTAPSHTAPTLANPPPSPLILDLIKDKNHLRYWAATDNQQENHVIKKGISCLLINLLQDTYDLETQILIRESNGLI